MHTCLALGKFLSSSRYAQYVTESMFTAENVSLQVSSTFSHENSAQTVLFTVESSVCLIFEGLRFFLKKQDLHGPVKYPPIPPTKKKAQRTDEEEAHPSKLTAGRYVDIPGFR